MTIGLLGDQLHAGDLWMLEAGGYRGSLGLRPEPPLDVEIGLGVQEHRLAGAPLRLDVDPQDLGAIMVLGTGKGHLLARPAEAE